MAALQGLIDALIPEEAELSGDPEPVPKRGLIETWLLKIPIEMSQVLPEKERLQMEKHGLKFNPLEKLARTSFSNVYRGFHGDESTKCVLKVAQYRFILSPQFKRFPFVSRVCYQNELVSAEDAEKEFLIQKKCSSDYVLAAFSFTRTSYFCVLVLEDGTHGMLQALLHGSSKWEALATQLTSEMNEQRFDPDEERFLPVFAVALYFLAPMFLALRKLHSLGVIHVDVKPENILITEGLVPKLADFGASVHLGADEDNHKLSNTSIKGTYPFMAPEVDVKSMVCYKSDIFSLGVTMILCLSGDEHSVLSYRLCSDPLRGLPFQYRLFWPYGPIEAHLSDRQKIAHKICGTLHAHHLLKKRKQAGVLPTWWTNPRAENQQRIPEMFLRAAIEMVMIFTSERACLDDLLHSSMLSSVLPSWTNSANQASKLHTECRDSVKELLDFSPSI